VELRKNSIEGHSPQTVRAICESAGSSHGQLEDVLAEAPVSDERATICYLVWRRGDRHRSGTRGGARTVSWLDAAECIAMRVMTTWYGSHQSRGRHKAGLREVDAEMERHEERAASK